MLDATGITATAGIGTNLYLAKVAMDIWAKHTEPDKSGVRIAAMDEMSYRRLLWDHRPLTDFWRLGPGYAKKLEAQGLYTMGDIARCSIGKPTDYYNEELLYKLFGVNAELLIDHSWGYEPVTMADIKAYKPEAKSVGSGQVLTCPYTFDKARMVVWEMADQLALDLVGQRLATNQLTLTVGYDIDNLRDLVRRKQYHGEVKTDRYGRQIPKHAHGTANLEGYTASSNHFQFQYIFPGIIRVKLTLTDTHGTGHYSIPNPRPCSEVSGTDDGAFLLGILLVPDGTSRNHNLKFGHIHNLRIPQQYFFLEGAGISPPPVLGLCGFQQQCASNYWSSWSTPWGTWLAWASMAWADWIRMLFLV